MRIGGHHNRRGKFKVSWTREVECGFYSRFGNLTFIRVEKFEFAWTSWCRPEILIIYTIHFLNGGTFSLFIHFSNFELFLKIIDIQLITQHSKRIQCGDDPIPIYTLFDKQNKFYSVICWPPTTWQCPTKYCLETSTKASPTSSHPWIYFSSLE